MGFRVEFESTARHKASHKRVLGFGVQVVGCRVQDSGCRVEGAEDMDQGAGCEAGVEFTV